MCARCVCINSVGSYRDKPTQWGNISLLGGAAGQLRWVLARKKLETLPAAHWQDQFRPVLFCKHFGFPSIYSCCFMQVLRERWNTLSWTLGSALAAFHSHAVVKSHQNDSEDQLVTRSGLLQSQLTMSNQGENLNCVHFLRQHVRYVSQEWLE